MEPKTPIAHFAIIGLILLSFLISISSAGLSFKLPFLSFKREPQKKSPQHHPQETRHPQHANHNHHNHNHDVNHIIQSHTHTDQSGKVYLHSPDSTVRFYYKENFHGPSNQVDIHHDGCREVPLDYWYNRPKSLWAKHCITLYQSGHCEGEGVQVAGSVLELRSAGMHYGVNSFKPCDKNIRIRFMPPGIHKHKHHHDQ